MYIGTYYVSVYVVEINLPRVTHDVTFWFRRRNQDWIIRIRIRILRQHQIRFFLLRGGRDEWDFFLGEFRIIAGITL